jgi:O-antigen/teichoic acid export membrane protein
MPLPEGTVPVGIGLLVAGVASYAFFIVGKGALGEEAFEPVASLWFMTFALAPGFFLPLEQEVGRALAHRRALAQGGQPVVRRVVVLGAILATIVSVGIIAVGPFLTSELFDGNWVMTLALVCAFLAYAPAHLSRGICSGTGRFTSYAIIMGADGFTRIAGCALLAIVGSTMVGAYGFVVAFAPLTGVLYIASRNQLRTQPGPEATWGEVTPNLGWLLIGSVLAAALVNAGPLATALLASDSEAAYVTRFANAVLLARVPLFLFQAVQAAMLPRLARLAARGDLTEFRNGFGQLMKLVLAVGAAGTLGAFTLGPFVYEIAFDAEIGARTLGVLALGSACYMVALATAQAVIALQGHAIVALGWFIGMVAFIVTTLFASDDLFRRVEFGLFAGSAAAMMTFVLGLRHQMQSDVRATSDSIFDAITDMPLEG